MGADLCFQAFEARPRSRPRPTTAGKARTPAHSNDQRVHRQHSSFVIYGIFVFSFFKQRDKRSPGDLGTGQQDIDQLKLLTFPSAFQAFLSKWFGYSCRVEFVT
jgi:hypothetical protein